jgi:hypothetical protein
MDFYPEPYESNSPHTSTLHPCLSSTSSNIRYGGEYTASLFVLHLPPFPFSTQKIFCKNTFLPFLLSYYVYHSTLIGKTSKYGEIRRITENNRNKISLEPNNPHEMNNLTRGQRQLNACKLSALACPFTRPSENLSAAVYRSPLHEIEFCKNLSCTFLTCICATILNPNCKNIQVVPGRKVYIR